MSVIAEAVVSVSVETLIRKLASEGLRLFQHQEHIRADLKKWEDMLLMIKAVLNDVEEEQQIIAKESVKIWLGKLQNLAYDVEEMLDEFEYESLRRKFLLEVDEPAADQPSTSKFKFRKLIPTCCTRFSSQSIQFDSTICNKIKEISARFDEIAKQKEQLGLGKILRSQSKEVRQRLPTTSLVNEAKVYGREKEKEEIVQLLLRDDIRADVGFSVIPITGMGGLGKTPLAQLIYNDERVQDHFDLKAWVCVSEDFDIIRVTKTILKSVATGHSNDDSDLNFLQEKLIATGHSNDDSNLNSLQEDLKKLLSRKKFLIILDDVWNENYNNWIDLSRPLEAGAQGSKIIVTTRSQVVAKKMELVHAYPLKKLSNDDCLPVFAQHSLGTLDFSRHPSLEEIGRKIVIKCDGLPLAAKTLGGILRGKYDPSDWENVLNRKIWDLPERECDIMPALRVSYHYLSPCLKQCFADCSLFPKDYEFQEEEIILLWMAEGFLHDDENNQKKTEDVGRQFFKELHSRSFFQQSSSNTSRFVMHDLINDLAQWAATNLYFRMEDKLEVQKEKLRHLSYTPRLYDNDERFRAFYDAQHLRTILSVPLSNTRNKRYLACSALHKLFKFPRLRVLSLRGYHIVELPESVGNLKHLRYLNLFGSKIETLPESINTLYNLHSLILQNCDRLKRLCVSMGNLIKLHHLNNIGASSLEEMPLGISKLTSLQTLSRFVIGKGGSELRELKSLKHLRKTLEISRLENVKDAGDAMEAELNGKSSLKALLLEWSSNTDNSMEPEIETQVLGMLKPHQNLEGLFIKGYSGTKFPSWLGDSSFSKLVLLQFEGCGMCTSLPSVGQLPFLKHLSIIGMGTVKSLGPEFYGNSCSVSFPSLETLYFRDMEEWKEWIPHGSNQEVEAFPRLRRLFLSCCPKLVGTLPEHLPLLETLKIFRCERLIVSISSLPTVCKLEIEGCGKMEWKSTIDLSSLNSVVLQVPNQVSLTGLFKQELLKLEEMEIKDSEELTYIWQSTAGLLKDISSLRRLKIEGCPQLVSLMAEEELEQQQQRLSCRLQYLEFRQCKSLVKLPQALLSLSSLRELFISDCNSLVSFPEAAQPSQLRTIEITGCNALESLPEAWMHTTNTSLESLYINKCNSLTCIAIIQISPSLKRLDVLT